MFLKKIEKHAIEIMGNIRLLYGKIPGFVFEYETINMVNHITGGTKYAAEPPNFTMLTNVKLSRNIKNRVIEVIFGDTTALISTSPKLMP